MATPPPSDDGDLAALLAFDRAHVVHPYATMTPPARDLPLVASASGAEIRLATGETLVDGVSSWWSAVHGYNRP